jgi:hypothetical protein
VTEETEAETVMMIVVTNEGAEAEAETKSVNTEEEAQVVQDRIDFSQTLLSNLSSI